MIRRPYKNLEYFIYQGFFYQGIYQCSKNKSNILKSSFYVLRVVLSLQKIFCFEKKKVQKIFYDPCLTQGGIYHGKG